jgi:site-specific DNA-methyltransferase (adenine-specific)
MSWELYQGDCLEIMPNIPDHSIDMILCDLPYGTTACKWDTVIPFEPLWAQYKRIVKDDGAVVLTASQPFTSKLTLSNLDMFRYCIVWEHNKAANFAQAPYMPLKINEDIVVFSKANIAKNSTNRMKYNPLGVKPSSKICQGKRANEHRPNRKDQSEYVQRGTNYPNSIIYFPKDGIVYHPTQKPIALFEYLIRTFSNCGETVLDNCAGSGTTGIAAEQCGRNSIMIEKEPKYCEIIRRRMASIETDIFSHA